MKRIATAAQLRTKNTTASTNKPVKHDKKARRWRAFLFCNRRVQTPVYALEYRAPIGLQLEQMRIQRPLRRTMELERRIRIDDSNQFIKRSRVLRCQPFIDLLLAFEPVRNQSARLVMRLIDQMPMTGCNTIDIERQQFLKRPQIGAHVTVGRRDDHGRPLHHVIAGKQQAFFKQQITQVIRSVSGGMHCTQ